MNNRLLVFSIVLVVLLIGLNFESLYNYLVWYIPLSKINQSELFFVQKEEGGYNLIYSPTMKDVNYINDDSIEITFAKTKFTDYIPNDFEFTKIVQKGDTIIAMCKESEKGIMYSVILQLTSISSTFVSFNHYETDLPKEVECKYPEIIKHSFDIPWKH
jgi:hypothetical protein